MTPLLSYFIQGSLVTAILLMCYKLLLRRDTFFKWSRWYFVSSILASFGLPLVDFSFLFTTTAAQPAVINYLPDLSFSAYHQSYNPAQAFINSLLYAGMLVMTLRLMMQMAALVKLRRNKKISSGNSLRIVELNERINPFSFFNEIYVNPSLHSEAELAEIIQHEQFHIKQKHTIDILLGELLTIVFWFNPFAWLMKNELKQNLEFLTDKLVLATGIDARHYQYNLLKVSGLQNNIAAANHFHFLKLKNRIIMMNKKQTHPYHAVKFLLPVPLVALLLMAFTERKELIQTFNEALLQDTMPTATDGRVIINTKPATAPNGEVVLPKNVKQIEVANKNGKRTATVTLKNGTKEVYDLNNESDQIRMEQKYGPIAEPPAPPAPPSIPSAVSPTSPASPPGVTVYVPKQEAVLNAQGYYLTVADDEGECVVIIKDKNKKILEAIKLTDWDAAKAVYEKKYGKIPPATPKATLVPSTTNASKNGPGNPYTTAGITFKATQGQAPSDNFTSRYTDALIIVDGVKQTKGKFSLNSIEPNTIESISILKDVAATAIYGDEGKDGVIIIKTKKKEPTTIITGTIIDPRPRPATTTAEPLYIVDGKERTKDEIKNIEPASIESVSVLKAEQAIAEFGEKGKNGAVKIVLKK